MKVKHEHNQMMMKLWKSLRYVEFDDVKHYTTTKKMWDNLVQMHGGDKNVLRAKIYVLGGKFDDIRIKDGEIIAQYCGWIKEVVNAIKGARGIISDEIVISKVLRTLLPIYAIRVSIIQKMRCTPGNNFTLGSQIGRLTTIELSNSNNYCPTSVEFEIKAQLNLDGSNKKRRECM